MAFTNLVSLIAFASCALLLSSNSFGVNAVAIENHGNIVARHHALHHNIALKKRSSNSQRCKQRPSTTSASTTSASAESTSKDSEPTSSSKAQSSSSVESSSKAQSTSKTSTSTSSQPQGTSGSNPNAGNSGPLQVGLAWAVDNEWASMLNQGTKLTWYHHWADPPVPQLSNLEYVPMYWGPSQESAFNSIIGQLNGNFHHLCGQNEPDVPSQSNQSPQDAANDWMRLVHPWGAKGVTLVSPAIAFSIDWMQEFLTAINSQGGYVDKIDLHWYGAASDIDQLISYVKQAHSQFGKNIWMTEIGLTTASGPSEDTVLSFMQNVIGQLNGLGYVERISWFGAFAQSDPPDGFASGNNALFYGENSLTPVGNWYVYSG